MFTSMFSFNVFCMSMPVNRLYLDCWCLSSFTWFLKLKPKCSVITLTVDFLKISILLHLLTLFYLVNTDASLRYSIGRRPHSFCDHVHLVFIISNSIRLWIKTNKGKYIFRECNRFYCIKSNPESRETFTLTCHERATEILWLHF